MEWKLEIVLKSSKRTGKKMRDELLKSGVSTTTILTWHTHTKYNWSLWICYCMVESKFYVCPLSIFMLNVSQFTISSQMEWNRFSRYALKELLDYCKSKICYKHWKFVPLASCKNRKLPITRIMFNANGSAQLSCIGHHVFSFVQFQIGKWCFENSSTRVAKCLKWTANGV